MNTEYRADKRLCEFAEKEDRKKANRASREKRKKREKERDDGRREGRSREDENAPVKERPRRKIALRLPPEFLTFNNKARESRARVVTLW